MKVSILVAVYNGERFLQKCLDSLYCQTYKNIEIICVNDGSTDNTPKIIEKYAKSDKRIKVINQKQDILMHIQTKKLDGSEIM